jgi:RNA polymerase sigma-70 factor (ECF subfamily)
MSQAQVDQQLVERAQKGDSAAFDLLVIKYQGKVHSIISRFLNKGGYRNDIEDVAQEAFIKAYRALPKFRGDSAFYTWLYRIAVNTAKNHLISGARKPQGVEAEIEEAEQFDSAFGLRDIETPETHAQIRQLEAKINESIENLSSELKAAITLREFEGLSYEEIAEILECPVGTVRSRIFRARESIDEQMKPLLEAH